MASPFPCCPVNRECHVKENPDRKKKKNPWDIAFFKIIFLFILFILFIYLFLILYIYFYLFFKLFLLVLFSMRVIAFYS